MKNKIAIAPGEQAHHQNKADLAMWPTVECLVSVGRPYLRPARVVGDLPDIDQRITALEVATMNVARELGLVAVRRIGAGVPTHVAFGMTRPQAKEHAARKLLLTAGIDLPLDYCEPQHIVTAG